MARGAAQNTETIYDWLTNCDAVTNIQTKGSDPVLQFTYDETKVPPAETVPVGVFFDLSKAPF